MFNGIKILAIIVFLSISTYQPLGNDTLKLYNIIWSSNCDSGGDRLVVGVDKNMNGIIDACYSIKEIRGEMHYKRVKIFYNIDRESNTLVKQGCVCNE